MTPEIIVAIAALGILLLDLFLNERQRTVLAPLAALAMFAAFAVTVLFVPRVGEVFGGRFVLDAPAWWFKLVFELSALIAVLLSMDLLDGRVPRRARGIGFRGEYYSVLLSSTLGMMCLISARDLATLFVSLELATLPLFVLAAWRRDDARSSEAGLKYVILGALASAFILYGFSFLYGLTGTANLDAICRAIQHQGTPLLFLVAALVVAGVGFKLTIAPFHLWAADVYEGAPTPVTAYLSVASKAAGLALAFQVFFRLSGGWIDQWTPLLAIFAALTMTLGNVVAIVQENIKRFMAFSAISQAGYFLLGFLGAAPEAIPALLFYMLVYMVTNLAAFGCIVWYSNNTGRERIGEYRGLSQTNPIIALTLMLALFSLAGIPPLSGFVGKFFLFSIASKAGYHWLVALAAVNSTISLYYYLRVVRQMYIEPPDPDDLPSPTTRSLGLLLGTLSVFIVLLGVVPWFYGQIHESSIDWLPSLLQR